MPTRDHPSDDPEIDSMADVGQWTDGECPTCGGAVRCRCTNLRTVARTGIEAMADMEYQPAADLRKQRDEFLAALEEIIKMEDKAWKPMRCLRSERQAEDDEVRHETWTKAADIARAAIANAEGTP